MIKRLSLALAVAALVAGCSSGVDLDNVPVEDKSGSALPTTGGTGPALARGALARAQWQALISPNLDATLPARSAWPEWCSSITTAM